MVFDKLSFVPYSLNREMWLKTSKITEVSVHVVWRSFYSFLLLYFKQIVPRIFGMEVSMDIPINEYYCTLRPLKCALTNWFQQITRDSARNCESNTVDLSFIFIVQLRLKGLRISVSTAVSLMNSSENMKLYWVE